MPTLPKKKVYLQTSRIFSLDVSTSYRRLPNLLQDVLQTILYPQILSGYSLQAFRPCGSVEALLLRLTRPQRSELSISLVLAHRAGTDVREPRLTAWHVSRLQWNHSTCTVGLQGPGLAPALWCRYRQGFFNHGSIGAIITHTHAHTGFKGTSSRGPD